MVEHSYVGWLTKDKKIIIGETKKYFSNIEGAQCQQFYNNEAGIQCMIYIPFFYKRQEYWNTTTNEASWAGLVYSLA